MGDFAFIALADHLAEFSDTLPIVGESPDEAEGDPVEAAFNACADSLKALSQYLTDPGQREELLAAAAALRRRGVDRRNQDLTASKAHGASLAFEC